MEQSIFPSPLELLNVLIREKPNAYIKIDSEYLPARTELFNFNLVRTTMKNFNVPTYEDLPVIFTCDSEEKESLDILQKQLINREIPNFEDDYKLEKQLSYLLLLFRINV